MILCTIIIILLLLLTTRTKKVNEYDALDIYYTKKIELFKRRLNDIDNIFNDNDNNNNNNRYNHQRHNSMIHRHNLSHHLLNRTSTQQKLTELYTIIEDLDKIVDDLSHNQKSQAEPLLNTPFDWSWIENRANHYYNWDTNYKIDPKSLMLLGVYDELLYRRMPQWFDTDSGFHIKSASELEYRLIQSRELFNRDCRRDNIMLYMCTISKNNAVDLQEWVVWQIVVVGVQQIIIYLNGPDEDNSIQVLQPFVDLGFVTTFNATGTVRQRDIYNQCISVIRKKSCNYGGPDVDKRFLDVQDCDPSQDLDNYKGNDRPVFVAGFDDDEMAIDIQGGCVIDQLGKYTGANGLIIPWVVFGHSNHFLTPKNELNIESYTLFMGGDFDRIGGMGKGFSRVYFIKTMKNSHMAQFINNRGPVNEYGVEASFNGVGVSDEEFKLHYEMIKPRLFLGHYV
jgi:hypothetical protein